MLSIANSHNPNEATSLLSSYVQSRLTSTVSTILLVSANVDDLLLGEMKRTLSAILDSCSRADVSIQQTSMAPIDSDMSNKCLLESAKHSLVFLLCDLRPLNANNSPYESLSLSVHSPKDVAEQITSALKSIDASVNADNQTSDAEKPSNDPSILTIGFVQNSGAELPLARLIGQILNKNGHSLCMATCIDGDEGTQKLRFIERWGRLPVAVLAAGKSSRMGRSKQVENVNGQPMVVTAVQNAMRAGADDVILITGAYHQAVHRVLDAAGLLPHPALHIVHNQDYEKGQSTSVKAAVTYVMATLRGKEFRAASDVIVIMPVDQPYLSPLLITRLMRFWRRGALLSAPAIEGIPRGAPALFDRLLWNNILQLSNDVGAKQILREFRKQLVTVETSPDELRDIDTPTDLSQ